MKTTLTTTTILILCILTISQTGAANAQVAAVGVNEGDTFTYNYNITWDSTNPSANVPAEYVDINNTNFIRLKIVNITSTLINIDFIRNFRNGTDAKQNGNIDVNSQILEIPYGVLVIRANASPNEKIYPAGGYATLKETSFRTYSVGQVETIQYVTPETSGTDYERTVIFYSRSNGVALEYNFETRQTSGSFVTTTKVTLIIASWSIPESEVPITSSSAAPESPLLTSGPTQESTTSPSPGAAGFLGSGVPMEYVIAIIVVLLVAVVAVLGFLMKSRNKLKTS